jgi:ABC-type iron transport system FetAB ATPase subunit
MNMQRVNNFRMGAYAAFAVGLINLRYQTGSDSNLSKSLVLVIPGALILALSFTNAGKSWMQRKSAGAISLTVGALLLAYSFIV